jgi:uncharacterized spore protein YtfJ
MSLKLLLQSWTERLGSTAHVRTVFGDPIECGGKTIVPVARVSYGLGGGAGPSGPSEGEDEGDGGGGAGGGVCAAPAGVVEVTRDRTRFIPAGGTKKLIAALTVGFFLGLLIGRRR